MKAKLLLLSVLCAMAAIAAETNAPPVTNKVEKTEPQTNAAPIDLQSAKAIATKPPRLPVYVLPEVFIVYLPNQTLVFVEQHHIAELAKKFPSSRSTNIIIYSDGL
jgi:hypothetical protein